MRGRRLSASRRGVIPVALVAAAILAVIIAAALGYLVYQHYAGQPGSWTIETQTFTQPYSSVNPYCQAVSGASSSAKFCSYLGLTVLSITSGTLWVNGTYTHPSGAGTQTYAVAVPFACSLAGVCTYGSGSFVASDGLGQLVFQSATGSGASAVVVIDIESR